MTTTHGTDQKKELHNARSIRLRALLDKASKGARYEISAWKDDEVELAQGHLDPKEWTEFRVLVARVRLDLTSSTLPDYAVLGMADRSKQIRSAAESMTLAQMLEARMRSTPSASSLMKLAEDGPELTDRTTMAHIGNAMRTWDREIAIASFAAAVASADFSHVTQGHPVAPKLINVYRRAPGSPTAVELVTSFRPDNPIERDRIAAILAAKKVQITIGGTRGPSYDPADPDRVSF